MDTAYTHSKHKLQTLLDEAAARQRYWTLSTARWEALCREATTNGVEMPAILRELGLRMTDRSSAGTVHLG